MSFVSQQLALLGYFLIGLLLFLGIVYLLLKRVPKHRDHPGKALTRHHANPAIAPDEQNDWEAQGTFNPAAVLDDEGVTHLLYRALGGDGISRFGYAKSADGTTFSDRLFYPVFQPGLGCGIPEASHEPLVKSFNPFLYASGGGWSGAEDPRAVRIDDRVYVTYTAFEGWHSVRVALTSIALADLKKQRWNWKRPLFLSPKNEVHKNWVIFPEKIAGKYAILHSITPEIRIEYVDRLDSLRHGRPIKSPTGSPQGGRKEFWDNRVRGAGAPPIKTQRGWLILYHAINEQEPDKYKIGAMLLDLADPTRVIARSPEPILAPDMHYENDYKPGVVYATGAIVSKGMLYVYYGGGDKHVCVAHAPLPDFLDWLTRYGAV